ncbi:NmrA family transcriptional regulator, partial [Pseudomonas syringae pv. tagetis]
KKGHLCLPFGSACISPIAANAAADVSAIIQNSPKAHIRKSYALTGPESMCMNQNAPEFSRVLERKLAYVSLTIDHKDN